MNAEHVQRIVVAKSRFEFRDGQITDDARDQPDAKCRRHADKSGRRRDGGQSRDHARRRAEHAGFAFEISIPSQVQLNAAAAAEKWVAANALVASAPAFNALPALKPNQPTHNSPAPISESTTLCGIIGSRGKPSRLPIISAKTSADTPELMCTTVPPAKSSTGIFPPSAQLNNPPLPHIMWQSGR